MDFEIISPPEWVKDAVFYQIFPDRFAKSDAAIKRSNLEPWDSTPSTKGYKGGDLIGLVNRLDYLVDLGINAIYLNPIFQSASNHRYHTHDYFQVDPLLGGNQAFRTLIEAAHRRDIRIVLDGVFNHASRGFYRFNDLLENGAKSPWLDWFIIKGWPLNAYDPGSPPNYECWWDLPALPKFNTDNPEVREYIMGVAEYWLREFDIDGWRLDVPTEIRTPGFWEEFRYRVKKVKPDAYIVGEIWHSDSEWVNGTRFDALMNYSFAGAVIAFTAGDRVSPVLAQGRPYQPYPQKDGHFLNQLLDQLLREYEWEFSCSQLNILASHDTPRLLSLARGDKASQRLATLIQMTYPGAPCVYYGDEIAVRGSAEFDQPFNDPDARWAFPWQDKSLWDLDMLSYFKDLIHLRRSNPVLRHGCFKPILAKESLIVYSRSLAQESLLVAVNAGREEAIFSLPADRQETGENTFELNHDPQLLFGSAKDGAATLGAASLEFNDSKELQVTLPARSGIVFY